MLDIKACLVPVCVHRVCRGLCRASMPTGLESDGSSFRCMAPSEESGHRQDGDLDVLAVQSVRQAAERLEGKAGHVEEVRPTIATIAQWLV